MCEENLNTHRLKNSKGITLLSVGEISPHQRAAEGLSQAVVSWSMWCASHPGCALLGARSCSYACLRCENYVLLAVNFVVYRLKVY